VELQERVSQVVTYAAPDVLPAWTEAQFLSHYFFGFGAPVFLEETGHLQNIINHAQTYDQVAAGGGTLFGRVQNQVIREARESGAGSIPIYFSRSYSFGELVWVIGDVNVIGNGLANVTEKEDFLIISADIKYYFNETFRDARDILNRIPDIDPATGESNYQELPGGAVYKIIGEWRTRIEATIKKDANDSKFPDG